MPTTPPFRRAARSDYAPSVRPRTAGQNGQPQLTPGYLSDLSDTKFLYVFSAGRITRRATLVTPSSGMRLRVIRVAVHQIVSDGVHYAELFFGAGVNISIHPDKAIDFIRVPDQGEGSSRSWGRGHGPVGQRNEVLSMRWTFAPDASHRVIVEYTEER